MEKRVGTRSMMYTALITPFDAQGNLDEEGLATLLQTQTDGVVLLGTTGEAPTLTASEKEKIVRISRQVLKNQRLIVGAGTNSTEGTLKAAEQAADLGADALLLICPYYNKPSQEGLFRHFESIASKVKIPIILYNNPKRTGVHLDVTTLARLAEMPQIIGIKESSGDMQYLAAIISQIKPKRSDFLVLSGDDVLTMPMMALGADGVVSVVGNLAPRAMRELTSLCQRGEFDKARALHYALMPLFIASGLEANPIPIKEALSHSGLPAGPLRLPLCSLSAHHRSTLIEAIEQCRRFL